MWTHFYDMHSGGGMKEPPYEHIFIEADRDDARSIFYDAFGHSPDRISCTCCGEDYSIYTDETLEELTGYHRGCAYANFFKDADDEGHLQRLTKKETEETGYNGSEWVHLPTKRLIFGRYIEEPDSKRLSREYMTLEDYLKQESVLVITAEEINTRGLDPNTHVPEEGWTWK